MPRIKPPETFIGRNGTVITPEVADKLAEEAERGYDLSKFEIVPVGRPSLGPTGTSPRLTFRVPPDTFAAAKRRAEEEGRSVSELGREALENYLDS